MAKDIKPPVPSKHNDLSDDFNTLPPDYACMEGWIPPDNCKVYTFPSIPAELPSTPPFVSPSPQAVLGGEWGLSLHDVALSCGAAFGDAKKKLVEREMITRLQKLGFSVVLSAILMESDNFLRPSREVESYVLDVNAAKFFVAKYENVVGDAYLAFLIKQEKKVDAFEALLQDPENAVRIFQRVADAKAKLASETAFARQATYHHPASQAHPLHLMISFSQWLSRRRITSRLPPRSYVTDVRSLVASQGYLPIKQTLGSDAWQSWTFDPTWLDRNHDQILEIMRRTEGAS